MFKKITLERTACFGACPEYIIQIDNTGKVKWTGIRNVSKLGEHEWTISPEAVKELNDLIDQFGYAEYVYKPLGPSKTDFPSVITSVEYTNGHTKKINHYLGDTLDSNALTEFENKIEKIATSRVK
ncbi:DUF6438 domain-containing protein [Clostridium aciditolerans]|uniref:DUF6438 domain-containing protein n=1 Tax=Clostridium aciditolerans TaxID=339861 RepID=A0A934HV34_9CLOT|nr:DUF6438 domain-containing protein [Clostridium aciditolerans]MBI6874850.1 hypothetical protein [Clostridium aciditolerans]